MKIKVTKKNIEYLKLRGYNSIFLNDFVEIKTIDLNPGSHTIIDVECDVCGKQKKLMFQKYYKNIKNGGFYACSSICANNKVKNTTLKKYGVDHYTKTDEYKKSVEETSMKKYGCKHFTQNNEIKNKIKETNLKKYGVTSPLKIDLIRDKIKETNLVAF